MKARVLFDGVNCCEYSPDVDISELLTGDSIKTLLVESEDKNYSIIGVQPVRIGSSACDHICVKDTNAAIAMYTDYLEVLGECDVYLNGKRLEAGKHPLVIGDSLWIGSTNIVLHDGYVTCCGDDYTSRLNLSTHTPEIYDEFPIYKRSPRIIKRVPTETIEIASPKAKEEPKKGGLIKVILPPLMMIMVTVSMGMMLGRGLFVMASAAMMSVTLVFSITNFFSDRKERKQKEKERIEGYERYLLEQRKKLYELNNTQKESLLYHNLSPREIEREILSYSSRLYERAANDSDFLTLSLGYSTIPISYNLKYDAGAGDTTNKDPLVDEMRMLGSSYKDVENMPTVIDLKQAHLGLVGEKTYIHRQLTSILTQLCFFQSYHDIEIVLLVEQEDWEKFEWVRWYPHCRIKNINITGLVAAENQRDQVLGNIAQTIKSRKQKSNEEKKDSQYLPHYIFIIDNPKLIINHSIMEYLQTPQTNLGFSIIYTTHIRANLPDNILTVFMLDGGDRGTLLMNQGNLVNSTVTLPTIASIDLETVARKLAPIKHSQGVSTQIPENVSFFELYDVKRPDEIPVLDLWERNACHKTLAVPLGLRGKDDIVFLNLHEKAHGPHGLVAGTTGSGKSEIVQSYILSLAVNFHPHEVGFLLIDYKGGGMANLFSNLPHLLGTITNLDGSESMRALASIKSELARRQRIFNDCGVNSINQYSKLFKAGEVTLPLPHLFIISDEFAELKKEQPDFMAELVSTARIGRSLGVHLILATQKPSGVVDDQIWSNSKFKLALKVADESDSNEMLKTPDAARITQPGRAYLQVGNNEIYELFQSAYSGAPFSADRVQRGFDSRVYLLNPLGQGELLNEDLSEVDAQEETKLTQLDVTVSHIQSLYENFGAATVERPWLPPLPYKLVTPHISQDLDVGSITTHNLSVPMAMVDVPEEQIQTEYVHDFQDDGNFAVFGASGFGKSTMLMNVALTLASNNSPSLLNYFILDYGNSGLAQLRGLPHTADYLTFDDSEKLEKLVKLFAEELKNRKSLFASVNATNFRVYNEVAKSKLPAILLFIDNYDAIREISADLEEFLVKLTRDGTGVGIYTIVAASRSNALRYSVLNNFKNKIALFMFDESDITAITGRSSYKLPEARGRAMIKLKDVHVAQSYLPAPYENDLEYAKAVGKIVSGISERNTASKATGVRVVPEVVTYADLAPYIKVEEKQAVLGFNTETTDPVYLDMSITCQLVVGASSTGKTNVLKLVAEQFKAMSIFVADSRSSDLHEFEDAPNVTYIGTESQFESFYEALNNETERRREEQQSSGMRTREFCASQPTILVLIDDGDNFVELCKSKAKEMEILVPKAMELGITFIVTTLPSKMRGYDNLTKLLRDTQAGIVLGNPAEQSIFQIMPPRGYKPVPNIGFWYKRAEVCQVKLPLMGIKP